MANVTLMGVARRRQQFTLPHDVYCKASGECRCQDVTVRTTEHNARTGDRLVRMVSHKVPGSVTILHKETVTLDQAVLLCPGIKAAIHGKPKRLRLM